MKRYLVGAALGLMGVVGAHAQETVYHATETVKDVKWPELKDSYLKTGDFINLAALRSVGAGQNYEQVRLALGNPHFSEGLGRPEAFNYAFNFYTNAAKTEWVTCQYQVTFNQKRRVDGRYWRDKQCERFMDDAKPARVVNLSSDGMFAFGRSNMSDLQQTGIDNLNRLTNQMLNNYSVLRSVEVIGHTDRIGSASANMALSQARANTVKAYFVSKGVPANLIQARGVGSTQPVQNCAGAKSAQVVACLLPNRRVQVLVAGDEK